MTGMESMVNNLIKSLSGMTIDEIKAQALQAQQHFLAFIKNVNDNFTILDYRLRQLTDAHTDQSKRANDCFRLFMVTLEQVLSEQQAARITLDNIRADLAPILRANGLDISDDLIEALKKRAGEGMPNGGIPHLVLIPSKLSYVPPDPYKPVSESLGLGGSELESETQSKPEDSQAGKVQDVNTRTTN